MNPESYPQSIPVAELDDQSRGQFIARTYSTLVTAILSFTLVEVFLFKVGIAESAFNLLANSGRAGWLMVLGGFMVVSWLARGIAHKAESKAMQYLALFGFVVAEALVFMPLLFIAERYAEGVIASAAGVTFLGFLGLTAVAFVTRKDFSFLRGILMWAGILALVAIVGGVIFSFNLGLWFSVAMVGVAGASILYDTSNVIHHYPQDRYVAAALELFASIALMFWYVLRIFLSRR
jgi:FtsH-binding integral membrane protein